MKKRPGLIPKSWATASIDRRGVLLGIAAIGGFLAVDVGATLYARGPVGSGGRLSPQAFIDAFRHVYGSHPGFRRNHAKGVAVSGYFDANGNGTELSRAAVFRSGRTPVVGRFSLPGGNPAVSDSANASRGLGLAFGYPGAEQWRTAMLNSPVFPDSSPQGFYDRLLASKPASDTGKPDPEVMSKFLAAHPETARAMATINRQQPTSGFGDSAYHGLNAFLFISAANEITPVRWTLVPMASTGTPAKPGSGPNWLFDNLIGDIKAGPLRWRLLLTVGEPDDDVRDATVAWPPERRTVDAGTVVIDSIDTERRGNARDINFDPMVLPDGIEPSEDPLLPARSSVYAASFRRRAGETGGPSAVQVNEVSQ
ncbi:catalase family peroxidase [Mycolicibacterium sp. YH-1]|uniref:catalase family peroxidase n=1 Tax=Mycolicibacterium sp. YH-1 TaxID=2908837 RepID=UPI001F4BF9B3|nr:catalase family peroxidase [Mycolicibacterium sp. YH-1]UNB50384.1 catalase family peroxidase [Mycolicibacterium sp. YH-1]